MNPDLEQLRRLSRAAFNQTYRLEVMLFIADSDGFVTQTEVAQGLGLASASNVQAPIRSLIECGLLNPMPKTDNRSRFLSRSDSPAWQWARQLRDLAGVAGLAEVPADTAAPDAQAIRPPTRSARTRL